MRPASRHQRTDLLHAPCVRIAGNARQRKVVLVKLPQQRAEAYLIANAFGDLATRHFSAAVGLEKIEREIGAHGRFVLWRRCLDNAGQRRADQRVLAGSASARLAHAGIGPGRLGARTVRKKPRRPGP